MFKMTGTQNVWQKVGVCKCYHDTASLEISVNSNVNRKQKYNEEKTQ